MTKEELLKIPFYIEDISGSTNTVTIKKSYSTAPTLKVEYSTDGITWTTATMNSNTTANTFTCPANGKLYLRGVNSTWGITNNNHVYNSITCSGNHNVGGNIMSLLYGSDFTDKTIFPSTNSHVFKYLFNQNTTLVNAQDLQLPATSVSDYCYYRMFYGCRSLITAPSILPATMSGMWCYSDMFYNCVSLTTTPELPSTILANWCYETMFSGCSSLTIAPELPATTLVEGCYQEMFTNCTSLTTAPELPATTLAQDCYRDMFSGCRKLNYIKANFIDFSNTNGEFNNWVYGVSNTGTFIMNPEANYNPENIRGVNGIPINWLTLTSNQRSINVISNNTNYGTVSNNINGVYNLGETVTFTAVSTSKGKFVSWSDGNTELTRTIEITEDLPYEITYTATFEEVPGIYFINKSENTNILTVTNTDKVLQYSIDYVNWDNIANNTITTIEFEDVIIIRGTNTSLEGVNFKNSELTLIEGNIMTLLHGDNITTIGNVFPEGSVNTFKGLFKDNTNLVDNSGLVLPETTVEGCYQEMFQGCTNLGITIENPLLKTYFYVEDISGQPNVFSINKQEQGTTAPELNLEYSTDTQNWVVLEGNTIDIPANSKVYLRGENDSTGVANMENFHMAANIFTCSGQYNVGGNIMSLLYSDECMDKDTLTNDFTFFSLFMQSTTLVNAKDLQLPATTLANGCYMYMFSGCTSLTTAPELPATTLADFCYTNMFSGCTSLITAPELPATTLADYCYNYMFQDCSSLQNVKIGYKGQINYDYFDGMFDSVSENGTLEIPSDVQYDPYDIIPSSWNVVINNKIGIITYNGLSTLPATELSTSCYYSMFQGCTSLVTAPELPATTLTESCYSSMFQGCTSLVTTPELPATELVSSCYNSMFQGCSKLNFITALFIEYSNKNNEFTNWVDGVAAEGTFKYNKDATFNPDEIKGVDGIPEGWLVKDNYVNYFYIEEVSGVNNQAGFLIDAMTNRFRNGNNSDLAENWVFLNIEYSFDKTTWVTLEQDLNNDITWIDLPANSKVYLRGNNKSWNAAIRNAELIQDYYGCSYEDVVVGATLMGNYDGHQPIVSRASINVGGDILTLMYGEDTPETVKSQELDSAFAGIFGVSYSSYFEAGSLIIDASNLILPDVVGKQTYHSMFKGCSTLTTAPKFPATTLAEGCYYSMFQNCTSLTTAPELPATTLDSSCYSYMFRYCSNLNYIKADFIDYNSSYLSKWVQGVSSTGTFVMNPEANYIPDNIRGVDGIPEGWTIKSIDYGVEILPLDGDFTLTISSKGGLVNPISLRYSLDYMNWEYITEQDLPYHINTGYYSVILAGDNLSLEGVHITGNSPYSMSGNIMCLLLGESGKEKECTFPEGTTNNFKNLFLCDKFIEDISGLVFPETTVDKCYLHMFTGCTGITTLPQLPATNLSDNCYHGMFMDCDGLTKVVLPEAYLAPYAYSNMFLGSENLSSVKVTYREDVDETNYKGWLKGVSIKGKFTYNHTEAVDDKIIRSNYYVPGTWGANYNDPKAINYFYIEEVSGENNQAGFLIDAMTNLFRRSGNDYTYLEENWVFLNIEYSFDKTTWVTLEQDLDNDITWINLPANSKVYLRGINKSWNAAIRNAELIQDYYGCSYEDVVLGATLSGNYDGHQPIVSRAPINVGGDILSLMYGEEIPDTVKPQELDSAFAGIFGVSYNSYFEAGSLIIDASKLILPDVVGKLTYKSMFEGCSTLTAAPEFPATTLADSCYYGMFSGTNLLPDCSKIDFTSETVVQSGGLSGLFIGTKVTDEDLMNILPINPETNHYYLPVMNLGSNCYNSMFQNCSSLTTAPELPATTLAEKCYCNMFYNCTNLTTAPSILPATTLANKCYYQMFYYCSSLTTAPELSATTLADSCYSYMFYRCSNLNYIKADFIDYNSNYFSSWVYRVSSTGTFVMNPNANYNPENIRGNNGIPSGWTVLTSEE